MRHKFHELSRTLLAGCRVQFGFQFSEWRFGGKGFICEWLRLGAIACDWLRIAEIDKTLLTHDVALREIFQKLRPLLEPQPEAPKVPKPEIGFHIKEDVVPYRTGKRSTR